MTKDSADEPEFFSDLLWGAEAIAAFLRCNRRRVYYLASLAGSARPPIFRMGAVLFARRARLIQWVVEQEERGWKPKASQSNASRSAESTQSSAAVTRPTHFPNPTDKDGFALPPVEASPSVVSVE